MSLHIRYNHSAVNAKPARYILLGTLRELDAVLQGGTPFILVKLAHQGNAEIVLQVSTFWHVFKI